MPVAVLPPAGLCRGGEEFDGLQGERVGRSLKEALVEALRAAEGAAGGPGGLSVQLSNVPLGPVV